MTLTITVHCNLLERFKKKLGCENPKKILKKKTTIATGENMINYRITVKCGEGKTEEDFPPQISFLEKKDKHLLAKSI